MFYLFLRIHHQVLLVLPRLSLPYLSCFCQLLKNLWGLPYSGSRQHADLMLSFPDMTTAWWGPILIVNTSPYFFWRLVNAKWVFFPSRCRWPMMGKRKYGPETHSRFLKYFQEKHFRFALKCCRFSKHNTCTNEKIGSLLLHNWLTKNHWSNNALIIEIEIKFYKHSKVVSLTW